MGKQVGNPFAEFVPPVKPSTSEGFSDFVQQPLSKEAARGLFARTESFQGDSQYDTGLTFGMDQNRLRAVNQPWYDQVANNAAKLIPAVALGLTENAGYIAELLSPDQDYTNALTEFATQKRQSLDESFPTYRENPEEVFDWKDSGWWAQHGMGLVESIGEFLITGAGVGGATGKGAKLLANTLKAGKYTKAALQGAAQLGTASTLAYTEGAMSGAQIFKQVLEETGDMNKAAEAASRTVQLNTILNTGLNLTALSPIFKTLDNLSSTARLGLSRNAGESLGNWAKRLDLLEKQGIPQASFKKILALEALQEGIEEDVNVFAESEGRIVGGLEKATSRDPITRFINKAFTEEGVLSFMLGALGGVGQTAGLAYIPYRTVTENGENRLISNTALNELQENEARRQQVATLRQDIDYLTSKQKELNTAVQAGDKEAIAKAKEDLFNIAALRSIRTGTSEEFAEEIRSIASIDNSFVSMKVGSNGMPDGTTEAMRLGYADSPNDNAYKQTAIKKAGDIKRLTEEYETLSQTFSNKFVADEVFRRRLNIYSAQEHVDNLGIEVNKVTQELLKLTTSPNVNSVVDMSANISALNAIIADMESKEGGLTTYEKRLLSNLKSTKMIEDQVLQQTVEGTPTIRKELETNKGIIQQLTLAKAPLMYYNEELKQLKAEYSNLLADRKNTEKNLLKLQEEVVDKLKKQVEVKKQTEEKAKDVADINSAVKVKNTTYNEKVGNYRIRSSKDGGFDVIHEETQQVINNVPSIEAAKAIAQEANKNTPKTTIKEADVTPPIVSTPKTDQPEGYQGKTKQEEKREEEVLIETVNQNAINENKKGRADKIAYRAKESDTSPISTEYLILHSKDFNINTPIVLKVAKETKFYKEGMDNDEVPIGVYHKNDLVGFVHINKGSNKSPLLAEIRDFVVSRDSVETTIVDKDFGVLNKAEKKSTTAQAMPDVTKIAIGVDGNLNIAVRKPYQNAINKPETIKDGITYAIITTPNGKEMGIPLDVKVLPKQITESLMLAFKIYMNPDSLLESDKQKLDEIFDKYDIDFRTSQGFSKYFKFFMYNYKLNDPIDIVEKNEDKNDKRWIEFTGNGIRYLKSGGAVDVNGVLQAKELSKNTPDEIVDTLMEDLENHINKMYYNIDLELLQANKSVSIPLLTINKNEDLDFKEYKKKNYIEHVKSITETNVVGIPIKENEYTYFVNPRLYFNTSFLGGETTKTYGLPPTKAEEKPIVVKKPLKSMTKNLPLSKTDPEQVTKTTIDERKAYCI